MCIYLFSIIVYFIQDSQLDDKVFQDEDIEIQTCDEYGYSLSN